MKNAKHETLPKWLSTDSFTTPDLCPTSCSLTFWLTTADAEAVFQLPCSLAAGLEPLTCHEANVPYLAEPDSLKEQILKSLVWSILPPKK